MSKLYLFDYKGKMVARGGIELRAQPMDLASKFWFRKAELPRKLPHRFQAIFATKPPITGMP